jgi:hypothetical protein
VPITSTIIQQIHDVANIEGMPKGLKVKDCTNQIFYDAAWIAGVDYNDYSNNEDVNNNHHDEDNEDYEGNSVDENIVTPTNIITQDDEDEDEDTINEEDHKDELENGEQQEIIPDQELDPQNENDEYVTHTGRISKPLIRLTFAQVRTVTEEYTIINAHVITKVVSLMNMGVMETYKKKNRHQFVQTFSLMRGLNQFGDKGQHAAVKEMKQLHEEAVFELINIDELTPIEKKWTMESLIFLTEKRSGEVKGRTCANRSTQRSYVDSDEAASPTAVTDSIIITSVIDAQESEM